LSLLLTPRFSVFPYTTLFRSMILAFSITATWWLINSLPLLKVYEQKYYIPKQTAVLKNTFSRLKKTLKAIYHQKHIFYYLISFRSEEHTTELQSRFDLVCRLL